MIRRVLVDTGPLVAIASARDEHHGVCVAQLADIAPPMLTCWPVLTETAWLLRKQPHSFRRLLSAFDTGLLQMLDIDPSALAWIARFMARYHRAQLADAALMYLAERESIDTVFTLDRRGFGVYRTRGRGALALLPAP